MIQVHMSRDIIHRSVWYHSYNKIWILARFSVKAPLLRRRLALRAGLHFEWCSSENEMPTPSLFLEMYQQEQLSSNFHLDLHLSTGIHHHYQKDRQEPFDMIGRKIHSKPCTFVSFQEDHFFQLQAIRHN